LFPLEFNYRNKINVFHIFEMEISGRTFKSKLRNRKKIVKLIIMPYFTIDLPENKNGEDAIIKKESGGL